MTTKATERRAEAITFSKAVALLREQQGLSQRALSQRAGLSPSYVQKIERGDVEPSFRTFSQLATALSMSSLEICVLVKSEYVRAVGEPHDA